MKRHEPSVLFAVAGLLLVCGIGAAVQAEERAEASVKKVACNWLAFNYRSYEHVINVEVNGKPLVTFDRKAGGFESKPSPFADGKNTLRVTFSLREGEKPRRGSTLTALLGPTMIPGADPLPGFNLETRESCAECDAEITLKDKVPGKFAYTLREWTDQERKHLFSEEKVETDIFENVFEKEWLKTWAEDGKPMLDEYREGGKIRTARYYKPGGVLDAEIKDGKGMRREYFADGGVAFEAPYAGGLPHGQEKTYDEPGRPATVTTYKDGVRDGECMAYDPQGKIGVRGAFKAGLKHGTWIRYGRSGKESAKSEFESGKLTKGTDRFPEFADE